MFFQKCEGMQNSIGIGNFILKVTCRTLSITALATASLAGIGYLAGLGQAMSNSAIFKASLGNVISNTPSCYPHLQPPYHYKS